MAATSQSMFEVMEALNNRMAQFESELQKTSPTCTTDTLVADFSAFKAFTMQVLRAFQQQLSGLAHDVDQQEMRSRRKILLLHGVQEEKDEESAATVTKTVTVHLKITDFNAGCISRCQRMGRATQDKPRPLLVKLRDVTMRDKLWFAKTNLKGTGITVSEFLTKNRHETFMAARQRFGVAKAWTKNGYIHIIGPDGTRHRVSNLSELQKIAVPESTKPAAAPARVPPKSRRTAAAPARK